MAHMPDIARLLFKRLRTAQRLSRRELAARAKTDPSYITLIERDGYTPSREKAIALAEVLSNGGGLAVESDYWLMLCGFAPPSLTAALPSLRIEILQAVRSFRPAQGRAAKALKSVRDPAGLSDVSAMREVGAI